MEYTKDLDVFFQKSYNELVKITLWILKYPVEHDRVHELLSEYYISCKRNNTLTRYDEGKGTFSNYIVNTLRNIIITKTSKTQKQKNTIYISDDLPFFPPEQSASIDLKKFSHLLNERENQILGKLIRGCTPAHICSCLNVSHTTISLYRRSLYKKWQEFNQENV